MADEKRLAEIYAEQERERASALSLWVEKMEAEMIAEYQEWLMRNAYRLESQ